MSASHQTIHLYYAVRHEVHLCEQERIAAYKEKTTYSVSIQGIGALTRN